MTEWNIWIDKLIEDETSAVEDYFFEGEDPLMEAGFVKKKAGRPKGIVETPQQKANKLLRKAKGHLMDAIKRMEKLSGRT